MEEKINEQEERVNFKDKAIQNLLEPIFIPKKSGSSNQLSTVLKINPSQERKEILSKFKRSLQSRNKTFLNEYLQKNNHLNYSSLCYVKTKNYYYYGYLEISNNKLVVINYSNNYNFTIENINTYNSGMINSTYSNYPIINTSQSFHNTNSKIISYNSNIISANSQHNLLPHNNNTFVNFNNFYNRKFFYNKNSIIKPLLTIDFNLCTVKLIVHKKKQKFKLIILGTNNLNSLINKSKISLTKTIKFKIPLESKENFYNVIKIIHQNIVLSKGHKENFFGVNLRKNFLYEYFITVEDFLKETHTCDLLLFKSYSKSGGCQRCITGSDYDHVALIIKNDGGVFIMDSTNEIGVHKRLFNNFVKSHFELYYEKVVYRKLIISFERLLRYIRQNQIQNQKDDTVKERINKNKKENIFENKKNNINANIDNNNDSEIDNDINNTIDNIMIQKKLNPFLLQNISEKCLIEKFYDIINEKINIFVKNNIQKEYKFSKRGFFCKFRMEKNNTNKDGYFCSELVAAAYYFCSLITEKYDSSNYLPRDFSKNGYVSFVKGFELGREFIIDFSS